MQTECSGEIRSIFCPDGAENNNNPMKIKEPAETFKPVSFYSAKNYDFGDIVNSKLYFLPLCIL